MYKMKNVTMISLTPRTIQSHSIPLSQPPQPQQIQPPQSAEINLNFESSPSSLSSILIDSNMQPQSQPPPLPPVQQSISSQTQYPIQSQFISYSKWLPSACSKETEELIHKIYENRKHVMRMSTLTNTPSFISRQITQPILPVSSKPITQRQQVEQVIDHDELNVEDTGSSASVKSKETKQKHRKMKFAKSYPSHDIDYYDHYYSSSDDISDQSFLTRKYYSHKNRKKKRQSRSLLDDNNMSESSSNLNQTSQLWNDDVENYYQQFQKICRKEAFQYKILYYRHSNISNILKVILILTSCFTFTLSISGASLDLLQITTIISSALTTTITSLSGFFAYEKQSEIEYNIYKELDRISSQITLELIKPCSNRKDPFEFIISLENRRDELFKSLHDKK